MAIAQDVWYKLTELVGGRQRVWKMAMSTPAGRAALKDLARVCGANESQWHEEPQRRDVLIGRREIWLYVQRMLNMSNDELTQLMSGEQPPDGVLR